MHETWVRSLSQEDPLEKGMATHSSILAWGIPWAERSLGATVHGVTEEMDMTERLNSKMVIAEYKQSAGPSEMAQVSPTPVKLVLPITRVS